MSNWSSTWEENSPKYTEFSVFFFKLTEHQTQCRFIIWIFYCLNLNDKTEPHLSSYNNAWWENLSWRKTLNFLSFHVNVSIHHSVHWFTRNACKLSEGNFHSFSLKKKTTFNQKPGTDWLWSVPDLSIVRRQLLEKESSWGPDQPIRRA